MRRKPNDRRCSYVVVLDAAASSAEELRELSSYLSSLSIADCDIVILDGSPRFPFEQHRRVLRWVGRHVALGAQYRTFGGTMDIARAAADVAACEKVIVATDDVRYTPHELEQLCELLNSHEIVEPQDYLEPLPWWGGIEASRMLVHRGIEPHPDHGATFGFRRSIVRGVRGLEIADGDDQVRRLASLGLEVWPAYDVFVKRRPPRFEEWLSACPRQAQDDFAMPVKSAVFFALLPFALVLTMLGGAQLAGGFAGAVACASMILAVRGRSGAGAYFPMRAILFAPVWVLERSMSVYWALYRKVSGTAADPASIAEPATRGARVASGE